MTTTPHPPRPPPGLPVREAHPRRRSPGSSLALGFGAGALLAYQGQYADRIYPGVTVDGVDVVRPDARRRHGPLERELAGYADGRGRRSTSTGPSSASRTRRSAGAPTSTTLVGPRLVGRAQRAATRSGEPPRVSGACSTGPGSIRCVVLDPERGRPRGRRRPPATVDRAPGQRHRHASPRPASSRRPRVAGPRRSRARRSPQALLERLVDPDAPDDARALVRRHLRSSRSSPTPRSPRRSPRPTRMAQDVVADPRQGDAGRSPAATVRDVDHVRPDRRRRIRPTVAPTAPTKALAGLAKKIDTGPEGRDLPGRARRRPSSAWSPPRTAGPLDVEASAAARRPGGRRARRGRRPTETPAPVALAMAVVKPKLTTEEAREGRPAHAAPVVAGPPTSTATRRTGSATTSRSRRATSTATSSSPARSSTSGRRSARSPTSAATATAARSSTGGPSRREPWPAGSAPAPRRSSTRPPAPASRSSSATTTTTTSTATRRASTRRCGRAAARSRACASATTPSTRSSIRGITGVDFVRFEIWGPPTGRHGDLHARRRSGTSSARSTRSSTRRPSGPGSRSGSSTRSTGCRSG